MDDILKTALAAKDQMNNPSTGSTMDAFLKTEGIEVTGTVSSQDTIVSQENTEVPPTVEEVKKELTEAEQAFVYLAKANGEFRHIVTTMTKKGSAGRVLESVLFAPFVETPLYGQDEEGLLEFCKAILYYRDVAMRDIIEKNPDKFKTEEIK